MERLRKQINFIMEVDKLKTIYRQSYIADGSKRENDSEHSWHLALMSFILAEYAKEKIDSEKVMKMVLIHDIVEIDAGDTYAYDESGYETKEMREREAAKRIFSLLPKDQEIEMWELWDEFESCVTPDAKFAAMLDRFQPLLLNHAAGGKSWKEHEVKKDWIVQRNKITKEESDKIWEYCLEIIDENIQKGNVQI